MEFLINRDKFAHALNIVSKGVLQQSTNAILYNNILINVDLNKIKISSYNLELGIEIELELESQTSTELKYITMKQGAFVDSDNISFVVSANMFKDIIFNLPIDTVVKINFEQLETYINICLNDINFKIPYLPADDYPQLKKIDSECFLEIDAINFKDMIYRTSIAVSNDKYRPVLNGILIEYKERIVSFIATDGYRLAKNDLHVGEETKESFRVIIPADAINEFAKIIDRKVGDDKVKMFAERDANGVTSQIGFSYKNIYFITRVIQGAYPEYSQVIPDNFTFNVIVKKEKLEASMKRAEIIASSSANIIKMEFKSDKDIIHLTAVSDEVGNFSEFVELFKTENKEKDFTIKFNVKMLIDGLKVLSGNDIKIAFTFEDKPAMITDLELNDYIYMIMPIKSISKNAEKEAE